MLDSNEQLKTVTQQLEDAHNKMLILDHNYFRVQKLHDSEVGEISRLQDFKADLEISVKKLSSEKEAINKDISNYTEQKAKLNEEIEISQKELISINTDIATQQAEYSVREDVLKTKEQDHSHRVSALNDHENQLNQWHKELISKHDKIQAFKETI